jgi:hypothetical protein
MDAGLARCCKQKPLSRFVPKYFGAARDSGFCVKAPVNRLQVSVVAPFL